jgi:uncharacterized protein
LAGQALEAVYHFHRLSDEEMDGLRAKTASAAVRGKCEKFKTSEIFDSTIKHPDWLTAA